MTAPVASPSMSPPDSGAAAAKTAAAAPDSDTAFGAMLSELEGTPDSTAPAAATNAAAAAGQQGASADTAMFAAALAQQMPWLAQLDATKIVPQSPQTPDEHDAASATNAPDQNQPQAAASQGAAPSLPVSVTAPPVTVPPATASQTALPDQAVDEPAAVPSNAAPIAPVAQENPISPVVIEQPATADHPKEQKQAHNSADADQSVPQNVAALTDLPSPVAAQLLGVPAAPVPQSPPAPQSQTNPEPKPQDLIAASALPAAVQAAATPAAAPADKTVNPKNAAATPATKAAADTRVPSAHDARAAATTATDTPQPAASTNDTPDRIVSNAPVPAEHGAKNETAPATPNLAEPAPAISALANHAALEISPAAASNVPPASPLNSDAPVRLSFTTPNAVDVPSFDALALKIAARSSDGENNFSIRLDPPELGRIEVNLNVRSDGHAQAELSADKPQTLELLQKDASSLERALKDAGLNLAGGLAFSLKGDGKSQAWRDMQSGSRGRALQIAAVDAANANADMAVSAALAAHAYGIPTARLDIRV